MKCRDYCLFGIASTVINPEKSGPSGVVAFSRDEAGNFGLLFGLLLPVILFFVGAGIDFTRINVVRTDLTESCDAAALAVARVSETARAQSLSEDERARFLRDYGQNFFRSNFQSIDVFENLSIDFDVTPQTVTPDVRGEIDTYILGVAFSLFRGEMSDVPLTLSCDNEITLSGSGRVEVALVVDVSGSMGQPPAGGGPRKIQSLRDSVDAMLDILYGDRSTSDNIRVGAVPFNAFVNPGGADGWQSRWVDNNAAALYHGDRFFHVDENGRIDTDTPVNHLTLYRSTPNIDWQGCVEARPYPLDELDLPAGSTPSATAIQQLTATPADLRNGFSLNEFQRRTRDAFQSQPVPTVTAAQLQRTENSLWVPLFAPDEADCPSAPGSECETTGPFSIRLTRGTVDREFDGADFFWFDRPSRSGFRLRDYLNRDFINDALYTGRANVNTQPFQQYAHIVDKFRAAVEFPNNRSSSAASGVAASDQHGASQAEILDLGAFLASYGANNVGVDEHILRQGYVGWSNPTTGLYEGKYNLNNTSRQTAGSPFTAGGNTLQGANMFCPPAMLSMTNDRDVVERFMDGLQVRGATNSAFGAIWAERLLSPEAPFEDPIADDDPQWQKAVVILTDGENFVDDRRTHTLTELSAYGFGIEERMGQGINSGPEMRDEIDNKLLRTCQRIKDRGYLVYTIMFDVTDEDVETVYRACASEPNSPFFFQAGNEEQLEDAFSGIAADLVRLHISR